MLSEYELKGRAVSQAEGPSTERLAPSRGPAKNRGRLDTVAEIVSASSRGANKSRIMLVANVNSVVATELLNKLVDSGLVSCKKEDSTVVYTATEEGTNFVNKYSELVAMLCPGTVPLARLSHLNGTAEAWI